MSSATLARSRPLSLERVALPASLLGVFICLVGGLMALAPALDPDLGWHLRTGYAILASHQIPHVDPYSFTKAGAAWVEHEWLWQMVMATIDKNAGRLGMIAANAFVVAAALALVY